MIITEFTPVSSLIGGCMIGAAAVLLMASNGRIAGISGIAVRMFPPYLDNQVLGRVTFILGIVMAPLLYAKLTGSWAPMTIAAGVPLLAIAGLLVGAGSVWGSGCTSGHGICGLARLSIRSGVAVATFMLTAIVVVFVMRHVA
jgi:uncharacterized protein